MDSGFRRNDGHPTLSRHPGGQFFHQVAKKFQHGVFSFRRGDASALEVDTRMLEF